MLSLRGVFVTQPIDRFRLPLLLLLVICRAVRVFVNRSISIRSALRASTCMLLDVVQRKVSNPTSKSVTQPASTTHVIAYSSCPNPCFFSAACAPATRGNIVLFGVRCRRRRELRWAVTLLKTFPFVCVPYIQQSRSARYLQSTESIQHTSKDPVTAGSGVYCPPFSLLRQSPVLVD